MIKVCNKCQIEKSLSDFEKLKLIYTRNICKSCRNKQRYEQMKDDPFYQEKRQQKYDKEKAKNYTKKQKERYHGDPIYRIKIREWENNYRKEKYNNDPEYRKKLLAKRRKYHKKRLLTDLSFREKWQKLDRENKKKYRERDKLYNKDKIEELKVKQRIYLKKRRKNDPKFRLNRYISHAIWETIKGKKNGIHWEELVGYSVEQLIKYLKRQLQPGMTLENYGKVWHIDHKIPIKVFNFTSSEHIDFKKCWSLKNLQPLWAKENMSKNDKIEKYFQPSLAINA